MGLCADVADAQWQAWLCALQSLNLAFFIAAEHQRLIRWRQVQADNAQNFSSNCGSLDSLKVRVRCGLMSFAAQIR